MPRSAASQQPAARTGEHERPEASSITSAFDAAFKPIAARSGVPVASPRSSSGQALPPGLAPALLERFTNPETAVHELPPWDALSRFYWTR